MTNVPPDWDLWLAFLPTPAPPTPTAYSKFVDAFISLVRTVGPVRAQALLNEFTFLYGGEQPRPPRRGRPRRTTSEQAVRYSLAKTRTKKQHLIDIQDDRNERQALRREKERYDEERAQIVQEREVFDDKLRHIGVPEEEIVRAGKRADQRALELHWLLWGQKSPE
jgi:hypothetical protein